MRVKERVKERERKTERKIKLRVSEIERVLENIFFLI